MTPEQEHIEIIEFNNAVECGIFAMGMMGMCPAHLMRSIGGGFDNESVAVTPMLLTIYFWVRSLRSGDETSHRYGILAGLTYFYMASCWGGYIFLVNLIAIHAVVLVLMGRFGEKVYYSYCLFYVVGTVLVMQVPVIGWAPLKSLEQIGALVVFVVFQVLHFSEWMLQRKQEAASYASGSTSGSLRIMGPRAAFRYKIKICTVEI